MAHFWIQTYRLAATRPDNKNGVRLDGASDNDLLSFERGCEQTMILAFSDDTKQLSVITDPSNMR